LSRTRTHGNTLLAVWSPNKVRLYDPLTQKTIEGESLASCAGTNFAGRDVIVAVAQRSAFIRNVPVPSVAKEEIAKLLPFKLGQVLPLSASETVSGFRLAREPGGDGHTAVVGAMKADSLRRIHEEAAAAGLRIRAVVPLAFGSWLVAREKALTHCAVVEAADDTLSIDVVADGELRYSRSVPLPETPEEIDQEVAATFDIAQVAPGAVVVAGSPEYRADVEERRHTFQHLSDPHTIDRLLFTLELPEKTRAKRDRLEQRAARRAVFAFAIAAILGLVAAQSYLAEQDEAADRSERSSVAATRAAIEVKEAEKTRDEYASTNRLLATALDPAQTPADIVAMVSSAAPVGIWFSGFTVERGQPLLVRGTATDSKLISRFVEALSKQDRFRDIRLVSATKDMIGKRQVVQFAISGRAVGNLPIEEEKP
jgi:Tfp pilus assembly protein PilN